MGTPKDSIKTKAKIIGKAGGLFAQKGFKAVTARDIAKKSGTPLSSINYHFRSKEGLYREVVRFAIEESSMTPEEEAAISAMAPEDGLKVIITEWLREGVCLDGSKWENDILLRELIKPTAGTEELVEKYFKPFFTLIASMLGKIVNKPADDFQVQFAAFGLASLVDNFNLYGQIMGTVVPKLVNELRDEDRRVGKIYQAAVSIASLPNS